MGEKLASCKYCGEAEALSLVPDGPSCNWWAMQCGNCGAKGPHGKLEAALAKWQDYEKEKASRS